MAKKAAIAKIVRWGRFVLTEAEIERQIAEATQRGEKELRSEPLATSARFDRRSRCVVIDLNMGSTLSVPVNLLQGLSGASSKDLARIEIPNPGCEIEWPALDQQFSIQGLLAGRFGTRRWMEGLAQHGRLTKLKSQPKRIENRPAGKKGRRIGKSAAANA